MIPRLHNLTYALQNYNQKSAKIPKIWEANSFFAKKNNPMCADLARNGLARSAQLATSVAICPLQRAAEPACCQPPFDDSSHDGTASVVWRRSWRRHTAHRSSLLQWQKQTHRAAEGTEGKRGRKFARLGCCQPAPQCWHWHFSLWCCL